MAMYRFRAYDDENNQTPEYRAINLAFGGSVYDNSVYIMGLEKGSGKSKRNFHKSVPIFELNEFIKSLKFTDNKDYYICPNLLKKGMEKRTEGTLFSVKNIVVDIDAHDYCGNINEIRPVFIDTLKSEFETAGLPIWNIQVFTGRGLQLWWCIEEASKKLLWLYREVQKGIMKIIQDVITNYKLTFDEAFTLDKASSGKAAGLFRLFGTFNYTAKTRTEVEVLSDSYFKINELKECFCEKKEKKEAPVKQKNKKGNFCYSKSINEYRIDVIERLVNIRGDVTGSRDVIAYIYYNECVQVFDRNEAKDRLDKLNNSFPDPLKKNEIKSITRCIDKAMNQKNNINCYILKNERIIEMLNMNDLEQAVLQFFPGTGGSNDKNRARDTRRRMTKETRNQKIIELAECGVSKTDIAKQANCSYLTVHRLMKKLGMETEEKAADVCMQKINDAADAVKEFYDKLRKSAIQAYRALLHPSVHKNRDTGRKIVPQLISGISVLKNSTKLRLLRYPRSPSLSFGADYSSA